jgi:exoribonuclease R
VHCPGRSARHTPPPPTERPLLEWSSTPQSHSFPGSAAHVHLMRCALVGSEWDDKLALEPLQEVECPPEPAGRVPCGRVVYIGRRSWRSRGYAGSLKPSDNIVPGRVAFVLFAPVERRFPFVRIRTQQALALMNKRITVVVDEWPADSPHPLGHYAGIIGEIGDLQTESQVSISFPPALRL